MENDNSDKPTQIMDIIENEVVVDPTTTPKAKPKRQPSTARNEHLARARSARVEAYCKTKSRP